MSRYICNTSPFANDSTKMSPILCTLRTTRWVTANIRGSQLIRPTFSCLPFNKLRNHNQQSVASSSRNVVCHESDKLLRDRKHAKDEPYQHARRCQNQDEEQVRRIFKARVCFMKFESMKFLTPESHVYHDHLAM